jgi:hypothetical protein
MGIAGSTLKVQLIRSLVRPDNITPLPSLAIDSCQFTDNSVGFLVTTVDLAKNMTSYMIPLKDMYSPASNTYVYIGNDESTLTFTKDLISGRVFCTMAKCNNGQMAVRQCVSIYEPLGNEKIDKLAELFISQKTL